MEITELVWKLFLLLFPGIITTFIYRSIATSRKYSPFEFTILSATFGIGVFILMELCISLFNILSCIYKGQNLIWGLNLTVWDTLFGNGGNINKMEIFFSYLAAFPLSLIIAGICQKDWIFNLLKKIGLTNRYGDDDVWAKFLADEVWMIIRIPSTNLAYFGYAIYFSDSGEKRELVLKDVSVYTNDAFEKLYEKDKVYLELKENDYSIEIEKKEEQDG